MLEDRLIFKVRMLFYYLFLCFIAHHLGKIHSGCHTLGTCPHSCLIQVSIFDRCCCGSSYTHSLVVLESCSRIGLLHHLFYSACKNHESVVQISTLILPFSSFVVVDG